MPVAPRTVVFIAPDLHRPLLTNTSVQDFWTLTGKSGSVSCGISAPFSWVLVCTRFCLFPPRVWWKQWQTLFLGGLQITADGDCSHEIKFLVLWEKNYDNLDSILKRRHYFANKGPSSQSYGFSSSHIWMWELDHKESWVPKNWKLMLLSCGVGEDSWESLGLQGDPTSPS